MTTLSASEPDTHGLLHRVLAAQAMAGDLVESKHLTDLADRLAQIVKDLGDVDLLALDGDADRLLGALLVLGYEGIRVRRWQECLAGASLLLVEGVVAGSGKLADAADRLTAQGVAAMWSVAVDRLGPMATPTGVRALLELRS